MGTPDLDSSIPIIITLSKHDSSDPEPIIVIFLNQIIVLEFLSNDYFGKGRILWNKNKKILSRIGILEWELEY